MYLCQVRSLVVMTAVCAITLLFILAASGRVTRLAGLAAALAIVVPVGFGLAVSLGGKTMTNRLTSLVGDDAGTVYYVHRGRFLEQTINEYLPRFPLGAGLGRWGMVHSYFSNRMDDFMWVEIQWTGWLFDGGLPLIILYFGALLVVTWGCLMVALDKVAVPQRDSGLSLWGGVIFAYNVGAIALCFNYPVFIGGTGLEFWLLNCAFLSAVQNSRSAAGLRRIIA
jgi:hypothetical protein